MKQKKIYYLEKIIDYHRNIKTYFHLFCDNVIRNTLDENLTLNSNFENIKLNNDI